MSRGNSAFLDRSPARALERLRREAARVLWRVATFIAVTLDNSEP
ncbi:MAG TPA: hypothetical protein VGV67_07285 [Solirubrobacteraceae bacterium]|nr:hypothetical protein [Solirubrobacteraceae bacterium]